MARSLHLVASGDFMHTMGNDTPSDLGFDVFKDPLFSFSMLPATPQTEAVPGEGMVGADGLLMLGQYLREDAIAAASDRLTFVARAGVGVDKMDVAALTRHGVLLFNQPDALTEATAAGALALILAASRNIVALDRVTREARWDDRGQHRPREIYDKTLGVIGPGRIGAELIRLVAPFRMKVLAYSPRLTPERAAGIGAEAASLDRLMAESDVVAICAPLSEETRGMVGARQIALMKPSAILVNVGRGPIVVQSALVEALRYKRIAAAGLDVFETQPVPAGDPIAALDSVVLCPHSICDTYELRQQVPALIARELKGLAQGQLPANIVNPDVLRSASFRKKYEALLAELAG
jgi:phosphoglycerate dehydrogenase-like enzyme